MQPIAYPIDFPALEDAWNLFMETGDFSRRHAAIIDPLVVQSWRRCRMRLNPHGSPRLSPARGQALKSVLRAQADLITMGTPIIEDIHQFIEGSDCAILLSDGSACILAVGGDPKAKEEIISAGLGQGVYWSEGQIGTTAIGMVLVNAMPVQVVGPEHYFKSFHRYATSAAPIHDVRGRIIGTLCLISAATEANPHSLALVMSAARALTNQIQANWSLSEANRRLSEVHTIMSTISEGVIAWDIEGKITHVNVQAGQLLGLQPAALLGNAIDSVLDLPELMKAAVENNAELRDAEVILSVGGSAIRSLISLRPIGVSSSQISGYITLLRPIEEVRQLVQQQTGTHATLTVDDVYGETLVMRKVIRQARIAAKGLAPVLIRGEGGVGKNHLAQAIHNESQRRNKPFLAVNCRAIPHELMASELLGEETELRIRPSKFELSDGGTLLLDEVESLSLEMQAALLQVIETGHVMRLGGIHPIEVDVRIIASTTMDLERLVADGSFLSHLFYRFGVFHIFLPPLRERTDDLPLLTDRFLKRIGHQDNHQFQIDPEVLAILCRYPWPGNVRELESVLERALHYSEDGTIKTTSLPEMVRLGRVLTPGSLNAQPVLTFKDVEREAIIRAGWACEGRVSAMAQQLKIGRTTLWRKMKHYNISPGEFKP